MIGAILTTWTNLGRVPQIVKYRRGTKRKSLNDGIVLQDDTDDIILAANGSEIYAKRNGVLEIYARNIADSNNMYKDVIANFEKQPITYDDLDSPDIKNRYKFIFNVGYVES